MHRAYFSTVSIILVTFFAWNFLGRSTVNAQILVNQIWDTNYGLPTSAEGATSILDASDNIYTTGHTTLTGGRIVMYVSKHDSGGNLIW